MSVTLSFRAGVLTGVGIRIFRPKKYGSPHRSCGRFAMTGCILQQPLSFVYCASIFSFSSVRYIQRSIFCSRSASSSCCRACKVCNFT